MDKTVHAFVRSFERLAWAHGVACQRVEEVSSEVRFILRAGAPPEPGELRLGLASIRQVEVAVSCLEILHIDMTAGDFARVRFQDAWTRLFTI